MVNLLYRLYGVDAPVSLENVPVTVASLRPMYILFEKYTNILALEMASPGNRHCASCIGALSLPITPCAFCIRPYNFPVLHRPSIFTNVENDAEYH